MANDLKQQGDHSATEGRSYWLMSHYRHKTDSKELEVRLAKELGWTALKLDAFKGREADTLLAVYPNHLDTIS